MEHGGIYDGLSVTRHFVGESGMPEAESEIRVSASEESGMPEAESEIRVSASEGTGRAGHAGGEK